MESFIGEEEQFVGDSELNRKPVEAFQGGGDVLPGSGTGEHSGSWVLHILQSIQGFVGEPEQDTVAVVEALAV